MVKPNVIVATVALRIISVGCPLDRWRKTPALPAGELVVVVSVPTSAAPVFAADVSLSGTVSAFPECVQTMQEAYRRHPSKRKMVVSAPGLVGSIFRSLEPFWIKM